MKSQPPSKIDAVRHSLAHLLAMAVLKKFPDAKLGIGPTIENGFYYDFLLGQNKKSKELRVKSKEKSEEKLTEEILPEIEKEMRRLISETLVFSGEKVTPQKARALFKSQPFKLDLIKEFVAAKKPLSVYHTTHEMRESKRKPTTHYPLPTTHSFTDLCKGGHIRNTAEINPEAFKLTHVAGAYWRGDEKNPMLTRIYGVAFDTKDELDRYLLQQEEARKRDHRVLGERLKIFTFAPEVGPGLPLWLPNGTALRDALEQYAKDVERRWGYRRVATPHIAKEDLYRMSGHIPYYAESMYPPMALDDGNYYLKAMNCPHTHMIYRAEPRSWRDLPLRLAEYGTVYRYERSGTLAGLLRVRGFTQNDAHIYCREDQVEEEFMSVMRLHEFWYKDVFGITDFYMRLSLPAKDKKKYADVPAGWKKAADLIRRAMEKSGLPYVEAEGEAAFYGPKIDFQIKSAIGREETCSTNQLDFLASERFGLVYKDKDGKDKPVYVIHRAPLGAHERFIAFLIEHYAGAFPVWLAPVQAVILPIGEAHRAYATSVYDALFSAGLRIELRAADETLGKRIRTAETEKIPYILIVGDKEIEGRTVSVRERGKGDLGAMPLAAFQEIIAQSAPPRPKPPA